MSSFRARRSGYDDQTDDDANPAILQTSISSPKTTLTKKLAVVVFLVSAICIGLITALVVLMTSHVSGNIGYAVCDFYSEFALNKLNKVTGRITLVDGTDGVTFKYNITGLKPNQKHAVFLHTYAGNPAHGATQLLASTGSVFNPGNSPHGCPTSMRRRAGDIPDLSADADGNSKTRESTSASQLIRMEGDWGVVGRSIVIYDKDNADCQNNPQGLNMGNPYGLCQIVVRETPNA